MPAYNIQWRSKRNADGSRTARIKVKRGAKPHYKTIRVRTDREAHKAGAAFAAEIDGGKIATASPRLLFSTYIENWLAGLNVRPVTKLNYTSACQCHIIPALGAIPLKKLSALDIKEAFAVWAKKLKPSSLTQLRNVLASALTAAEKYDLVHRSPMAKLKGELPLGKPAEAVPVPAHKVAELLAYRDPNGNTGYEIALLLCIAGGLRRGEACGAQWHDLDLDRGTLRVERQLLPMKEQGDPLYGPPKSEDGVRTIRLPAEAIERLREHRQELVERLFAFRKRLSENMPIACRTLGLPLDPKGFTAWAGRKGVKLHNLRHWHLTELLNNGRPLAEVSKIAGHSSIAVTMRAYAHADDDEGKAAEIIGKVFR